MLLPLGLRRAAYPLFLSDDVKWIRKTTTYNLYPQVEYVDNFSFRNMNRVYVFVYW